MTSRVETYKRTLMETQQSARLITRVKRTWSSIRMRLPAIRPSLTWRFAIGALVTIALMGYLLTRLLGQVITDNALENARAEARDTLAHRVLNQLSPEDLAAPMTGQRLADFERFVEESVLSERTARIKIWNTEGRIIYCDDLDQIGRLFPIDEDRAAAFAGETVSNLSHLSSAKNAAEEAKYGRLLEVYTPIVFPGSQEVVGAFEIYQVYGPVAQQIAETQRYLMFGLGGGLTVLYLALVGIVHGGTRVIGRQHRELEKEITERRRANEALRKSEERYRWLIESAPDAMVIADGDGRIVMVNSMAENLFGYHRDELVGRPVETLMPNRLREAHVRHRARYHSSPRARPMGADAYIVGRRRDRSEFPADISLSPLETDEGVLITATIRDITERKRAEEALQQAHTETVMLLAASAEAHDHTTGLHLQSVRALTEALARELGYSEEDASTLGLASVLHDMGKIRVPDDVLTHPGPLMDEEWGLMKQHTVWGAEFLAGRPGFELAATIARCHHERWDGSGYPDGLAGEAIPEAATIVAVADSFDAMTHDRPYRARRPPAQAVQEIVTHSGTQFNPRVVEALVRLYRRNALPLTPAPALDQDAAA